MEKIICKICLRQFNGQITGNHLKSHSISTADYHQRYGPTQDPNFTKRLKESGKLGGGTPGGQAVKAKWLAIQRDYEANPSLCKRCMKPLTYKQHKERTLHCSRNCGTKTANEPKKKDKLLPVFQNCIVCNEKMNRKGSIHQACMSTICKVCNKPISRNLTQMCKSCYQASDIAMENRGKTFSKTRGYYESISGRFYYMSGLELDFLKGCDKHNINISKPSSLLYVKDDKKHTYFPDFEIDGIVYEIKGFLTSDDKAKMTHFPEVVILYKDDIDKFIETGVIDGDRTRG